MRPNSSLACSLLAAFVLGAAGCDSSDNLTAPGLGTLEVTSTTVGAESDPDGYMVQIDSEAAQLLGLTETVRKTGITPGDHSIQLSGIAPNCTVAGNNPRTVSIAAGQTATVTFEVTCGVSSGGLQVTAATTGASIDADGYTLTVDGSERGTLQPSGGLTLAGLIPGPHDIGLSGVAGNCTVEGDNPRTVTVVAGEGGTLAFIVTCTAPPANAGTLRVTTATTGTNPDPDGYSFTVDGGASQPVGVNGTASIPNVAAGARSVQLGGLAGNCAVQGSNPSTVTVSSGATAEASFAISCTATSNSARLVASATTVRLKLGQALTLPVSAVDANGNPLSLAAATFEAHGDLVAAVNDLGLVRALEPGGDTVVVKLAGDSVAIEVIVQYPDGITHPNGVVASTTSLDNRPFGTAVSQRGDVLVTQLDAGTVARGQLPGTTLGTSIPVGLVPTDVTVDRTGTHGYVTNQLSSNVGVIDLATNTQVATIPVTGDPFRVRLSTDDRFLFVTGNADSLFIIDVASRAITGRLGIGLDANGLAQNYTGTRLYVSNQSDGTVSEVDLTTNTVLRSIQVGGHPQELVLSPGGTLLFVADESGSVQIWSLRQGTKRGDIQVPGGAFAMAVSPDWHQLYISSSLGGAVYMIDWKTGATLKTVTTGGMPRRIAFTADGTTAVVANEEGWVDYIR